MTSATDLAGSAANIAAKEALVALVCARTALALCGAGVSVPADFPAWEELLRGFEPICDSVGAGFVRDPAAMVAPLDYAEKIKIHINNCTGNLDRYTAHLVNEFSKTPRLQGFHHDLIALPFRGFLTTNYESTLEAALAFIEHGPPDKTVIVGSAPGPILRSYLTSLSNYHDHRLIAHIHGHFREPASIVLSSSDYAAAYGLNSPPPSPPSYTPARLVHFLQMVLGSWSVVFVGFSFRDPHFAVFLEASSRFYGLWNTSTHYALLATSDATADLDLEQAERLKAEYGIETVFYEKIGNSHEKLYELIADIRRECGVLTPMVLPDINLRTIVGMRA